MKIENESLFSRVAWTLLLLLVAVSQVSAEDESKPKGADLKGFSAASAVVKAFVKAMRNEDLEAVMATVDVPWFQDGTRIIESKDALRDLFRKPIQEREFTDLKAEIEEVSRFASLRDRATGSAGELLKQVASDDDLVFRLKVTLGTKSDELMLLVRVKGDGAKIIGLRD